MNQPVSLYLSEIIMAASSCHSVLAVVPLFSVTVNGAAPGFVSRLQIIRARLVALYKLIKIEQFDTVEFSQVFIATGESALKCCPFYHGMGGQRLCMGQTSPLGTFFLVSFHKTLKAEDDDG